MSDEEKPKPKDDIVGDLEKRRHERRLQGLDRRFKSVISSLDKASKTNRERSVPKAKPVEKENPKKEGRGK